MLILTPWMACTVSNLGQFCKFWKMFFNQIYGPRPKRISSVTCNTDWENGVNGIFILSLGSNMGNILVQTSFWNQQAVQWNNYGPLKWQIIVHLLTEIYNYLLFHELLLKKSFLQKTYLSYQLESLCKGVQE